MKKKEKKRAKVGKKSEKKRTKWEALRLKKKAGKQKHLQRVHGEKEEDVKTRSGTIRRKTQTDKS